MTLGAETHHGRIQRRHTIAGRSAYDDLAWERRDARLVDHRDGSVAFEQVGVEFPEHWSLTASNIVAQKYFRGAPGGEGRESSLRQVIDRVVDAITSWGGEAGYFASACAGYACSRMGALALGTLTEINAVLAGEDPAAEDDIRLDG